MIEIDGSYGEAGGQIIRTAIALSAVTKKPCKIYNIRAGRCNPGLQAQHLAAVKALAQLCDAKVIGDKIGSKEIKFIPNDVKTSSLNINIGTAGAISLVLQTIIIPAIQCKKKLKIRIMGGTAVKWSPSVLYFQHVFCYYAKKIGINVHVDIIKEGFYPRGGGIVELVIEPSEINNIILLKRGKFENIDVHSIAEKSLKNRYVAERQINGFKKIIKDFTQYIKYVDALSPGSYVHAHAHYDNCRISSTVFGEKNKPAEYIGRKAAIVLKKGIDSEAPLDEYMEDQIIPYMALAIEKGASKIKVPEISSHTRTNIKVVEKFLPVKFEINEKDRIIICKKLDN